MLNLKKSLSSRILFYFFIVGITLIVGVFYTFEEAGKEAFKQMEKEKAEVIVNTIVPTIAMNLYLGMTSNVDKIIKEVTDNNENILGITVVNKGKVVSSYLKKDIGKSDYFIMTRTIKRPNSDESIGKMHVIYSYAHFKRLVSKYSKLLWIFLFGIAVLLILFSIYLEQLLSPLKQIVLQLSNYTPKKNLSFEFSDREDEIGRISRTLEKMQQKIRSYALKQENMNKILEEKVQQKTQELKNRLYVDSLTGLPNRFRLQEDLENLNDATLIIINIDDFKELNDLFGHKTGDKILASFAQNIKNLITTNYPKFYRFSGDEFAMLFNRRMTKSDIEQFLSLLANKIENMTFFHGDKELSLHVTMGAYIGKEGALEKADIALKKAKQHKKSYEIYEESDKSVEIQYQKNIEWIKRLKKSIDLERVIPYFQAIVNAQTKKPKGYECLMRIRGDEGEIHSPYEFLEIAKKSRYYPKLTQIMIAKSCQYFQHSNCSFSINFSILDIMNKDIVQTLKESIEKYQVADRLILEIVESEGIENYSLVYDFVTDMKNIGCQIAIDDFGTGYSNFEHILQLPIDYIKIDGSLVKNVSTDENSELIISTIVNLAKKKKIATVAEFVSSAEIYEKVKALGVDYVQGYYFAKPEEYVEIECDQ